MWSALTVTRLGPIRENKMQPEDEIKEIIFEIVRNITIHQIDAGNSVIEVDYEHYVDKIVSLLDQTEPEALPD